MLNSEWIELPSGAVLHRETVKVREEELGWSAAAARRTPVQRHKGKRGAPNVAALARADRVTPSKVQLLMRQYGVTYAEARDHLKSLAH